METQSGFKPKPPPALAFAARLTPMLATVPNCQAQPATLIAIFDAYFHYSHDALGSAAA